MISPKKMRKRKRLAQKKSLDLLESITNPDGTPTNALIDRVGGDPLAARILVCVMKKQCENGGKSVSEYELFNELKKMEKMTPLKRSRIKAIMSGLG